jgi:hypothetical protein
MKRIIIIAIILLSAMALYAQKDNDFYKHEIRASFGDAIVTSEFRLERGISYSNFSFSYFYRQEKFLWAGVNFVNYFGNKINYDWREYDVNGNFKDFSKSKTKYCAIIAPEIRLSCLNRERVVIYSALSGGVGIENGYDTQRQKYPNVFPAFHLTYFGLSGSFGKNNNIFLGGELGIGFKGLGSIHGGYRF